MRNDQAIFASRTLAFKGSGENERTIVVSLFVPRRTGEGWECEIEIRNLSHEGDVVMGKAEGIDSLQAALHGLEQVALLIYTSQAHKMGSLFWLDEDLGYGLPLLSDFADLVGKQINPMQILHVI